MGPVNHHNIHNSKSFLGVTLIVLNLYAATSLPLDGSVTEADGKLDECQRLSPPSLPLITVSLISRTGFPFIWLSGLFQERCGENSTNYGRGFVNGSGLWIVIVPVVLLLVDSSIP